MTKEMPEFAPGDKPVARPRPIVRSAPTRQLSPGDKVCGACGEGNPPARHFCSRCGTTLDRARRVELPWWQQLIWRRGGPNVRRLGPADEDNSRRRPSVGDRARSWQRYARLYGIFVVAAVAAVVSFYPPLRTSALGLVDSAGKGLSSLVVSDQRPIRPVSITATAQYPDHAAGLAFDGFTDTYWAAPFRAQGAHPSITIDLGRTSALSTLILHSGAPGGFVGRGRPSIVTLTYSNQKTETLTLADTPEEQDIPLRQGIGTTTVRIEVGSVHGGQSVPDVAIGEMEFFAYGS